MIASDRYNHLHLALGILTLPSARYDAEKQYHQELRAGFPTLVFRATSSYEAFDLLEEK
jgi:hypothetical protein